MLSHLIETISHLFHPSKSNRHRPRLLHPEAIIVLSGLMLAVVVGTYRLAPLYSHLQFMPGYILGYASNITVEQVLEQTNQARQSAGLVALQLNPTLSLAAGNKANHMFAHQYWAHTAPTGEEPWEFITQAGYTYRSAGENLARDFGHTAEMVQAWLASPTHRANILNGRYQETGIAVVNGSLQGVETTLVVQMFGSPPVRVAEIPEEAVEIEATPVPSEPPVRQVTPEVLARAIVPAGELAPTHYYQPQDIIRSVIVSLSILLLLTLLYDWYALHHHQQPRLVGKNLAHILLLATVIIIALMVKIGMVA